MAIRVVRLGSDRSPGEGLRIGTVRRPPRGVRRKDTSIRNFYDVWFPVLAPSAVAVKAAQDAETERDWARFVRTYRAEMGKPEARATMDLLAALSRHTDFSIGCYCLDESRCHRSILGDLLRERGALMAGGRR